MTITARSQSPTAAAVVTLLALCTACGGESSENGGTGGGTQTQPLCDGSDAIRLLYQSGGGMVEETYEFTNPHGFAFLAVTGRCTAFVGGDYMEGLRSVTLSDEQAAALAKDVGRDQFAVWSEYPDEQGCPDAGRVSLSDGANEVFCSCGCDPDVPPGIQIALDEAVEWKDTLFAQGAPLTGAVAAAARPDGSPVPNLQPFTWPLSWPVTDLPPPYAPSPNAPTSGKRIEDATDAATLRKMRGDALAAASYLSFIPIEDSSAARFQLYVRDELPAEVEAALQAVE